MGNATTARGKSSTAMGITTIALGNHSTAMGNNTKANGENSTAMGYQSIAGGKGSTAMGYKTTASQEYSTAMGNTTTASGKSSTAMGINTISLGHYSTSMGNNTKANGENSTAMGYQSIASGKSSTAMGNATTAKSYAEFVIGNYNTDYTATKTTTWNTNDRLFVVGNGANSGSKSDALVMFKNGNTTVSGTWDGTFNSPSDSRLKENIENLDLGMDVLNKIDTKQYTMKKDEASIKRMRYGIIAQELKEVLPNLVYGKQTNDTYLSVNYTELIPIMINALKEQQKASNSKDEQIKLLKEELDANKKRLAKIEKALGL